MEDIYSAADVIDKTMFAAMSVPIYSGFPDKNYMPTKIGTIKAGDTVGKVYSYITADPTRNRAHIWWMFYPGSTYGGEYYFAEHIPGAFDIDKLRAQGVKTVEETEKEKEEQNKPWYEKLADNIVPVIAGAIIAAAVIGAIGRTGSSLVSGKKSE